MSLVRGALADLPAYTPGRPAGIGAVKLSSNENPFPPLPGVLEAATAALLGLNAYPDASSARMLSVLAGVLDVPIGHLATGTGSVGILQQLVQSTTGEGDEVVYAWRSFEAYPVVIAVNGATGVPVPLRGEHHDLDAMAAAITPRTRLVLLCSPNNPTGTVISREGFARFMAQVPDDVLVVLDEAYAEFVRDVDAVDGLALTGRHTNLCVLRTFSKAHGLAGLRVGYAIAAPEVAAALRATAVAFGVSAMAQAAVIASLSLTDELAARVDAVVAERARVTAGLRALGWQVPDPHGNFVWLRLGAASAAFAARLEAAGLVVRPYAEDGVRITVGAPGANDRLLAAVGPRALAVAV